MKKSLLAVLLVLLPFFAQAQTIHAVPSDDPGLRQFMSQFWSKWSSPNSVAIPYVQSITSDPFFFYGKPISRDAYMKKQVAFAKRWPVRLYRVQPGSQVITCDDTISTCFVKGIVNFKDFSPARNATSTGSAKFSFSIIRTVAHGSATYVFTGLIGSDTSQKFE